jgi:uncharacterized protein
MSFWDSSAIVSAVANQPSGSDMEQLLVDDPDLVVWWGTAVELASAATKLRRQHLTDEAGFLKLLEKSEKISDEADQIEPTEQVRRTALRILRVHDLSAADALQLAAALVWTNHETTGAGFVCLDKRLREAAEREGFTVLPVLTES